MKMEAIILAGGLGTRLKDILKGIPKPMAQINGKPFLEYLLTYLNYFNFKKVILAVGYKKEMVENYFKFKYKNMKLIYSYEDSPLETGGAIVKALSYCSGDYIFVLNGDTFFNVNLKNFFKKEKEYFDIIIAIKEMSNFSRYGAIQIKGNKIICFKEKKYYKKGYINGGIYLINKNLFKKFKLSEKFSFEEFIQDNVDKLTIGYYIEDSYFIDIGIAEDYKKAQEELAKNYDYFKDSI